MNGKTAPARPPARPQAATGFLLDFGPLLLFFVAYKMRGIIFSTAVFVVAIVAALAFSLIRYRRVSPMTWISAVLIIGFGGLTIYLHDQRFIQMKPTIIYAGFAVFLFAGLLFGKPLLKYLFGPVFEGLDETGWLKLTRNWACFFAAMAVFNEALRATVSFDTWLTVKVWGATAASVLFGMANVPMLMRHGLTFEDKAEEPPVPPPSL
jgi:intracellular septation protein